VTRAQIRARNLEIQRRAAAGEAKPDLALAFGLSLRRVELIALRRTASATKVEERHARIVELREAGESHRAISATLGISAAHSSRVCRAAGAVRRDPKT
jgi:hypothetical protein